MSLERPTLDLTAFCREWSDEWLLTPDNVVSRFANGDTWCRLCGSYFAGPASAHVASHAPALTACRKRLRLLGEQHREDACTRKRAEKEARVERACALRDEGLPLAGIADDLGVGIPTVKSYLASSEALRAA